MSKEQAPIRSQLHSALDLMEVAVNAGITDPVDLAAKLKLGQAVADFMTPTRRAGIILPPQFEKVLERGEHIITMDLANGLSWDVREFGAKEFNAKQATEACKELRTGGFADWRESSIREQLSLVDYERCNPAIDKEFFPNARPGWYRTSTVYAPGPGFRWGVGFDGGDSGYLDDDFDYFVRAVRASQ